MSKIEYHLLANIKNIFYLIFDFWYVAIRVISLSNYVFPTTNLHITQRRLRFVLNLLNIS